MKLAKDDVHETLIKVDSKRGTIKLDRTNSGVRNSSLSEREFSVDFMDGTIELRIIIDRFTLEVFVNEGKQAASMKIDTDIAADKITFMSDETVVMDITKYDFEEGLF